MMNTNSGVLNFPQVNKQAGLFFCLWLHSAPLSFKTGQKFFINSRVHNFNTKKSQIQVKDSNAQTNMAASILSMTHLHCWWGWSPATAERSSLLSAHSGRMRSSCWCPDEVLPAGREPPSPQVDGWSSEPSAVGRTPGGPPPGAPGPHPSPGTAGPRGTALRAWRRPWWGPSYCRPAPPPWRAGGVTSWGAEPLWDTATPGSPQSSGGRSAQRCPAAGTNHCEEEIQGRKTRLLKGSY